MTNASACPSATAGSDLGRTLARYGLGAGAALAAGGAVAPAAEAAIQATTLPTPLTIESGTIFFDLDGGLSPATTSFTGADFSLYEPTGSYPKPTASGLNAGDLVALNATTTSSAQDFAAGAPIGPGSTFADGGNLNAGGGWPAFGANTPGYLGLALPASGGVGPFYGWAQVSYFSTLPGGNNVTLYGYAFEDSGAAIAAGAVPEPNSLLLLALGAGGLGVLRARRRRQHAGAADATT